MDTQQIAALVTVLVIGLLIGTDLGVFLMCAMRMATPDPEPSIELDRRENGNARLN